MKKRLLIFVLVSLLLLPVCAKATDITFTSSGTITDGSIYADVGVRNSGTVANLTSPTAQ